MIATTRREALLGAVVVPTLAGLPRWKSSAAPVLIYDPMLEVGRRLAEVERAQGAEAVAIAGDRIRFARALFERHPTLVMGVSRPADALLIGDVAQEAGYRSSSARGFQAMLVQNQSLDPGLVVGWLFRPRV